jgi:glycosyltransferase involved in cell wall biosynthesis
MRIAIVAEVFLPKIDGVVNRTLNLIRELQRCNDDVLVICPEADGAAAGPAPVVEFRSFPFPLYPEYRIARPDNRLAESLQRFQPDVLHFVNPFAFGFRCHDLLHKSGLRWPTVFSFHTLYGEFVKQYPLLRPLSGLFWWLMREYHNRADTNITVSSIMRDDLIRRGFQRVRYWPPAVDSQLFHPGRRSPAMRARLAGEHADKPLLLTVSRLAPEKNVGFLAGILDRFPDACLAVVGDGPQRTVLEKQFAGKNVQFIGYLRGVELAEAYASADAFVYASETETMGNVVLEAMACGCAVVAPRAGGIPSLVASGRTGLLYEPGNLNEAIRATGSVLFEGDLRSRLGQAARTEVEGWTWEHSIESVRQVYRETIQDFRRAWTNLTYGQRMARAVTGSLVSGIEKVATKRKLTRV